jgi:hypothetical protein
MKKLLFILILLLSSCDPFPEAVGTINCAYNILNESGCRFKSISIEGQAYRVFCIADGRIHLFPIDKCEVVYYTK